MKSLNLRELLFCTSASAQEFVANLSTQSREITQTATAKDNKNKLTRTGSFSPGNSLVGMGAAFAGIGTSHLEDLNNWVPELSRESW